MNNSERVAPILLFGKTILYEEDCACPDSGSLILFEDQPSRWTNDCACPDTSELPSNQFADANRLWVRTPNIHVSPLPNDFHLLFSPFAPNGPSVLNRSGIDRLQDFEIATPLTGDTIDQNLVMQRLVQPLDSRVVWQHADPATLTAWLHVTNACNLDCPYCYVRKSSARMSIETGRKAIESMFTTAQDQGFKAVKVKYAGGEATLHFRLVRALHAQALSLSKQTGIGLNEVILSNGVHLSVEDAIWIQESRIKLAISVDGVGNDHDQQRPMRNGDGSFAAIENTVDNVLLPLGIKPDITITVTQLNASGVADAVRWAMQRDLPVSLNFYRANPQALSRTELKLEESAIIQGMLEAYRVFEEILPNRPFLNGLLDRVQAQAHTHTCGVGLAYMVITHEGKLAQCQMHLDSPVADNLDGSAIPLLAGGPIKNLSVDEKEGCRDCVYRYRCTGGCPIETFRSVGRWDIKSPHCNIYKALLPETFRLEGLRLLKVNGLL